MYGEVKRIVGGDVDEGEAVMEGVEHLGKYVFEMTKAKVEALKLGGAILPVVREENGDVNMVEADEDAAEREENVLIKEGDVDDGDDGDDDVAEEPVV